MAPKLSIIVPVYNVENYLRKCLDSILNQTLTDIEVICVNDGSPDNSGEILKEYQKADNRVIIIEQENSGLGAARNTGISAARGEYIGFVDSDDFIDPTMYEKMCTKAYAQNADVVLCNIYLYYTDSGATTVFRDNTFYENMSKTGSFTAVEHPRILQFIGVWDRIYRRSFIEKERLRNPEKRIYEDVLFSVQTSVLAARIAIVNEPLYYYRKNTGISIVDKEVVTDSYKFDFLKNLAESRAFLEDTNKWLLLRKEFLAFQLTGMLYHQHNMQSYQTFIQFARELAQTLSVDDFDLIKDNTEWPPAKLYIALLQKHQFKLIYLLYKIRKLYRVDEFCIYIRFPKTKKYWCIKKPGYWKKARLRAEYELINEIKMLNISVQSLTEKSRGDTQ